MALVDAYGVALTTGVATETGTDITAPPTVSLIGKEFVLSGLLATDMVRLQC